MILKKYLPNILLSVCSFIFILAIIEIALHVINPEKPKLIEKPKTDWALVTERVWTEHDPNLGWALMKNKNAELKIEFGTFPMKFSASGFRGDKNYSLSRTDGVKRMAVIGDSFPFGWGVLDHEVFSSLLEKKYPNVEIPNFSVPGYGIDQIYLSYKYRARNYKPDVVLIGIYPEDFWRATRAFSDTGHCKPYFTLKMNGELALKNTPVPLPFTLTTNQFPEIIEKSNFERLLMRSYVARFFSKRLNKAAKSIGLIDPDTREEWKLGKAIIKQLIYEVKKDQAIPILFTAPPRRWAESNDDESVLKSIRRLAKAEGVYFIDFTPHFRRLIASSDPSDYYIPKDLHWTAKAHTYVADTFISELNTIGFPLDK